MPDTSPLLEPAEASALEDRRLDVGDDDAGALVEERLDEALPDAARSSRHDGDPSGQFPHG